jgi:hypothetical protein
MVKIRYAELPAGLHVMAETRRRDIIVYLQPGLTPAQRRAALIRVRSSARMGHGPALPARAMARAVAADRVRTTTGIGTAAMRRHPMLFLLPLTAAVCGAIVFMFLSSPLTTRDNPNSPASLPTLAVGAGQATSAQSHDDSQAAGRSGQSHRRRTRHVRADPSASPASTTSPSVTPPPASSRTAQWPTPAVTPTAPFPLSSPSATTRCFTIGQFTVCVPRWPGHHRQGSQGD